MVSFQCGSFADARRRLSDFLRSASAVDQLRWQGRDVSADRSAKCYEVRHVATSVDLGGVEDLDHWRQDCTPNLPWADDHFAERVGGEPLNPGVQWRNWPWGASADKFRGEDDKFNHTYMERLWPKYARLTYGGNLPDPDDVDYRRLMGNERMGIDRVYGDLDDLVDLLARDPPTRQAFIPLFFPEDTGWGDGGRKMCSLGYQFLLRDGRLDVFYPLRSCDFTHHWADDCYLAVRMLLWVLGRLRERDSATWGTVVPGEYCMWMTSLHVFENGRIKLLKEVQT